MNFRFAQSKNSFEGQLPKEKTLLLTRKHYITLFYLFLNCFFLGILPFIFQIFINKFSWYSVFSSVFQFLLVVYYLILWLLLFYNLMLYFLTCLIITDRRLIIIETKGLFKHERLEVELAKIQDISIKVYGFAASTLNFGDLEIQSAGAIPKLNFSQLPNPYKVKELIMNLSKTS